MGILAKEYLHSLTEPEEDSESKESDTEEKEVSFNTVLSCVEQILGANTSESHF